MWLMLQHEKPDDQVIATGETHSVREFLVEAFAYIDLDWRDHIRIDPKFYRPSEVDLLVGDGSKASATFGWEPTTHFKDLVRLMIDADRAALPPLPRRTKLNN